MTDSKYFTTTKKGEIFELKSELNSDKKEKKKEAVKKVIASMTVGEYWLVLKTFWNFIEFFNPTVLIRVLFFLGLLTKSIC